MSISSLLSSASNYISELSLNRELLQTQKSFLKNSDTNLKLGFGPLSLSPKSIKSPECYYIDQEYSKNLDIKAIENICNIFLEKIDQQKTKGSQKEPQINSDRYAYISKIPDEYARDSKISPEALYFIFRCIQRKDPLFSDQILKDLKPLFGESIVFQNIKNNIEKEIWTPCLSSDIKNLSIDEKKEYDDICNTFFVQRDTALHTFIKSGLEKDKEMRAKNPNASLKGLLQIPEYERAIRKKQLQFLFKSITITLVSVIILKKLTQSLSLNSNQILQLANKLFSTTHFLTQHFPRITNTSLNRA